MKILIAPSLLAADFGRLADEIKKIEEAGADWLHLDVMDGHFVPNLTIGPPVVEKVREATSLPLDVHLMLMEPEKFIGSFLDAGADSITVHAEALAYEYARKEKQRGYTMEMVCKPMIDRERMAAALEPIRRAGKGAGIALNPDTEAECVADIAGEFDLILAMTVWPGFGGQKFIESVVPKVEALRKRFPDKHVEVDGGLNLDTVGPAASAGANVIVAGTSTFRAADPAKAVAGLRARAANPESTRK